VPINEKPTSKAPGDTEAPGGNAKCKADSACEKCRVSKKKHQGLAAAAPPGADGGP